eukprot:GHVN01072666.1.p1 GENE.GHVN01072666.1~~GHVN01072666.1.p1  ORF type:complete len:925 (+),score=135.21 GHVN01072666.1:2018-4792(+)
MTEVTPRDGFSQIVVACTAPEWPEQEGEKTADFLSFPRTARAVFILVEAQVLLSFNGQQFHRSAGNFSFWFMEEESLLGGVAKAVRERDDIGVVNVEGGIEADEMDLGQEKESRGKRGGEDNGDDDMLRNAGGEAGLLQMVKVVSDNDKVDQAQAPQLLSPPDASPSGADPPVTVHGMKEAHDGLEEVLPVVSGQYAGNDFIAEEGKHPSIWEQLSRFLGFWWEGGETSDTKGKRGQERVSGLESEILRGNEWSGGNAPPARGDGNQLTHHNNNSTRGGGDGGEANAGAGGGGAPASGRRQHVGGSRQDLNKIHLVDSSDNQFVLSRPKSVVMIHEDMRLVVDLVLFIVGIFLGAFAAASLGQPLILGYFLAGVVMGPGGLNLLHQPVQVDSVCKLGALFLMFTIGLSFSFQRLVAVQRGALFGAIGGTVCLGAVFCMVAFIRGTDLIEGLIISLVAAMSSTAIVIKDLLQRAATQTLDGQISVGILVMQDLILGVALAVLPMLSRLSYENDDVDARYRLIAALMLSIGKVAFSAVGAIIIALFVVPTLLVVIHKLMSKELFVVASVAIPFAVAGVTEGLGFSIELGAFVGGIMLSQCHDVIIRDVETVVSPIGDILIALFFGGMGLSMDIVFVWDNLIEIIGVMLIIMVAKTAVLTPWLLVAGYRFKTSLKVALLLSHLGEFSFLLAHKGNNLGFLNRKVWLLLVGSAALSMCITPLFLRILSVLIADSSAPNTMSEVELTIAMSRESDISDDAKVVVQHVQTVTGDNRERSLRSRPSGKAPSIEMLNGMGDGGYSPTEWYSPAGGKRDTTRIRILRWRDKWLGFLGVSTLTPLFPHSASGDLPVNPPSISCQAQQTDCAHINPSSPLTPPSPARRTVPSLSPLEMDTYAGLGLTHLSEWRRHQGVLLSPTRSRRTHTPSPPH